MVCKILRRKDIVVNNSRYHLRSFTLNLLPNDHFLIRAPHLKKQDFQSKRSGIYEYLFLIRTLKFERGCEVKQYDKKTTTNKQNLVFKMSAYTMTGCYNLL